MNRIHFEVSKQYSNFTIDKSANPATPKLEGEFKTSGKSIPSQRVRVIAAWGV